MLRSAIVVLAAALALPALAQAVTPISTAPVTFTALDEVKVQYLNSTWVRVYLTGVEEGAGAASARYLEVTRGEEADFCERAALLMMERPGQYRFGAIGGGSSTASCKLTRAAP